MMSDISQNQCLSTALRSSLTGKGIHTHLAAIVGSKMTNHNIIDVLKKRLQTTVSLTTFAPIQRERVNLIMMTPVSFKPLFRPEAAGAGRARDGMNPQQSGVGGGGGGITRRVVIMSPFWD